MDMVLRRVKLTDTATLGELWLEGPDEIGKKFSDTLEDKVRPEGEAKVPGKTAIPYGIYKVVIDFSQRFNREMPHVLDVPGFSGIRIHPGNTEKDTEGCILVGKCYLGGMILTESRITFNKLMERLKDTKEIVLEIRGKEEV